MIWSSMVGWYTSTIFVASRLDRSLVLKAVQQVTLRDEDLGANRVRNVQFCSSLTLGKALNKASRRNVLKWSVVCTFCVHIKASSTTIRCSGNMLLLNLLRYPDSDRSNQSTCQRCCQCKPPCSSQSFKPNRTIWQRIDFCGDGISHRSHDRR